MNLSDRIDAIVDKASAVSDVAPTLGRRSDMHNDVIGALVVAVKELDARLEAVEGVAKGGASES